MKLTIIFVLVLSHTVFCASILGIFPTPSISHQVVFRALMKELAVRGHKLTILTPDPFSTENPNVTQIDLHSSYEVFRKGFNFVDFKSSGKDETDLVNSFFPVMIDYTEEQLSHPEVKKLIRDRKNHHFDVIIIEGLFNYAMLAFAEIFNAPVIKITSLDDFNVNHAWMGNEVDPVVYPDLMFPFQQKKLTFSDRWMILKYLIKTAMKENEQEVQIKSLIKKHFPIRDPDIPKLRNRIQLLMTNTIPVLGYLRPILPNTIQLGFMHIEPPQQLPEGPLKRFLDNSKNGVIYMSLGSNVQSSDLSPKIKRIFLNVFASLNFDILWMFESDDLENKPENVMIQKWLPQADLLAHPKIKLFITHGGQQSMEETIDRAVPTIVIPFLGDQDANARRMEEKKIGRHLDLNEITEEKLKSMILEVLKPIYKKNIEKLRNLIYDQPMSSKEKAVWWTEYVIRHKNAKHFFYQGKNISFYEKYFLDFLVIGLILAVIVFKIIIFMVTRLLVKRNFKGKIE